MTITTAIFIASPEIENKFHKFFRILLMLNATLVGWQLTNDFKVYKQLTSIIYKKVINSVIHIYYQLKKVLVENRLKRKLLNTKATTI